MNLQLSNHLLRAFVVFNVATFPELTPQTSYKNAEILDIVQEVQLRFSTDAIGPRLQYSISWNSLK